MIINSYEYEVSLIDILIKYTSFKLNYILYKNI